MPIERYFADQPLDLHETLSIEGEELHHLFVMRSKKGDEIEVINGQGLLARGYLNLLTKTKAEIVIENVTQSTQAHPKIILACALPKTCKLDWIIEKGTELGVDCFWLFPGDKSVLKTLSEGVLKRLRSLTIASIKQCGRLFLPEIMIKSKIDMWNSVPTKTRLFFGDTRPSATPFHRIWHADSPSERDSLIFVIGPESGLSQQETGLLETLGAQGVNINLNILRTETAAIASIAIIAALYRT